MPLDPQRTLADLHELRALTSDEHGAQRLAWSPVWLRARAWLEEKLAALPVEVHRDAAGNLWATLTGESERALLLGGHIDSVPNGGWLDGCLGTLSSLELLRALNEDLDGKPPFTVRLVDWAEKARALAAVCSVLPRSPERAASRRTASARTAKAPRWGRLWRNAAST